jgi:Zn finger protein HypA/HybF involved in hydrogenase expression
VHEHSVADAIVGAVEARRAKAGAARTTRAVLRVSELACLDASALQMMLDHATEEMGVPGFPVEVMSDGLLGHCPSCGVVALTDDLACGACGARDVRPAADEAVLLVACEFE